MMGLEGVEKTSQRMMENLNRSLDLTALSFPSPDGFVELGNANLLKGFASLHLQAADYDGMDQMQLLVQAQALLKKSEIYQKLEETLQASPTFHPSVYFNLMQPADNHFRDDSAVSSLHRDAAVNNLRFLNIFYGYSPMTFAMAVNMLDRLLGKVKVHPRYLSCIATCCFIIAFKKLEQGRNVFFPSAAQLVKLSQCGGSEADLMRMERLILDKLEWQTDAITPLTFFQLFYEMFIDRDQRLAQPSMLNSFIAKLEVLMGQFEFTKYKAETLALALLSHCLQELDLLNSAEQITPVIELQYFCQIPDAEFMQCKGLVSDYLVMYGNQPSKLPRLQLTWTVSRRTLNKLRPSTRCILDLEPIMEDEIDSEDEDDTGPFDSENDDMDGQRAGGTRTFIVAAEDCLNMLPILGPQGVSADRMLKPGKLIPPLCSHCPTPAKNSVLDHNQNACAPDIEATISNPYPTGEKA